MVVEPFVRVPKAIHNTGFGIGVQEEIAVTDPTNAVVGPQVRQPVPDRGRPGEDPMPRISHDAAETDRRLAVAHELFDGLLEVRPWGADPYLSLWDPISTWMGVENALYALVDRPEFMHRLVGRMTDGYLSMLDQLEAAGAAVRAPEPDPLHRRLHRRTARAGLRPGQAAHEGHLDVRPGADVLHGLAGDVQGVRGGLRQPHLRALRPGLLRLLRPAGRQDGRRCA